MTNIRLNKYKPLQFYSREILSPVLKSPKCSFLYLLMKNFSEIVGQKYKDYCKIEKVNLINENKQGNIYLVSFNSSVSFYLNNNKIYIIEKINAIFGYNAVANIFVKENPKLVVINSKNKKIISEDKICIVNNVVGDVKNDKLKNALIELGKNVLSEC